MRYISEFCTHFPTKGVNNGKGGRGGVVLAPWVVGPSNLVEFVIKENMRRLISQKEFLDTYIIYTP